MSLTGWFNKTRKYVAHSQPKIQGLGAITRKLETTDGAAMRIFGQFKNPTPGKRSGRDALRVNLRGPALKRWYTPHLRTQPGLWNFRTESERYMLAKNSFLRTKGKLAPKKGSGKKALKRMADARKAAAKKK